jgi:predicted  nucleic acid-binding Zn-ribbon protein
MLLPDKGRQAVDTARLWLVSLLADFQKLPLLTQYAVIFLCVTGLIVHFFAYNEKTAHDGPTLFTTAGIFFTFVGIAEGLYGFDVSNIETSIPGLLSGLKTAFFASVIGVFLALSLKVRLLLFGVSDGSHRKSEGATVDDLVDQIAALREAVADGDGRSLISEIKLQRQDSNDRLDALRRSLTEFVERAAENNSKALIEALREVIRDFNSKISEQFGENFKQLNAAVGQLLEWQSTYRAQLTELIEHQSTSARNMGIATTAFQSLTEHSRAFTEAGSSLVTLLSSLDEQRSQIENSIKSLGQLLSTASSAIPQIERNVMQLTEQMTFGVQQHQQTITAALTEGTSAMHNASSQMKSSMMEALQAHNQETNNHLRQLSDRMSEQISKLDLALEKELSKSISTLGSQLTSLSKQFVDDYAPLIDRLREFTKATRAAV